jgi:hypothetical protein
VPTNEQTVVFGKGSTASKTLGAGSNESVAIGGGRVERPAAPTCSVEGKLVCRRVGAMVS